MDVALWAIQGATLPKKVWSLGGRFLPDGKDQGETPNMQLAVYDYGETLLVFETRGLVGKSGAPPRNVSNEFYTSEGMIKGWNFYPSNGGKPEPISGGVAKVTPGGPFGSFIAAVRSRRPEDVNCDAEVAHYSAALCHLANISHRLGKDVPFSTSIKGRTDNQQVSDAFAMVADNLQAVKVRLDDSKYTLGRELNFDASKEQFVNDDEANQLLTRSYRKPFVVPEQV